MSLREARGPRLSGRRKKEQTKKKIQVVFITVKYQSVSPLTQMFIINSVIWCCKSIRIFPIIFSAPVAAKRPQKPRRLKKARSSAPVSLPPSLPVHNCSQNCVNLLIHIFESPLTQRANYFTTQESLFYLLDYTDFIVAVVLLAIAAPFASRNADVAVFLQPRAWQDDSLTYAELELVRPRPEPPASSRTDPAPTSPDTVYAQILFQEKQL